MREPVILIVATVAMAAAQIFQCENILKRFGRGRNRIRGGSLFMPKAPNADNQCKNREEKDGSEQADQQLVRKDGVKAARARTPQRAGNDDRRRKSPRPLRLTLKWADPSLQMLAIPPGMVALVRLDIMVAPESQ